MDPRQNRLTQAMAFAMALALVLPLLLSQVVHAQGAVGFSDLSEQHWAAAYVEEMTGDGRIAGYPDGTFRPEALVTLAEFLRLAFAQNTAATDVSNTATGETNAAPTDVPHATPREVATSEAAVRGHWARMYYDEGIDEGIFTRYDLGASELDRPIRRDRMALILSGLLGDRPIGTDPGTLDSPSPGVETTRGGLSYGDFLERIRDVDARTPYEYPIVRAYAFGLLAGYPDGTFRPGGFLTRAEAATVLWRLGQILPLPGDSGTLPVPTVGDGRLPDEAPPAVVLGSILYGEPEGTLTFTIHGYDAAPDRVAQELESALRIHLPVLVDELMTAFRNFAPKPAGSSGQGIRKQYVGDRPILMERILDTLRIFAFPAGYTNRTWNTKPGEINESFF